MESILWAYAAFFVCIVFTAATTIAVIRLCSRDIDRINVRLDALENKEIEGD